MASAKTGDYLVPYNRRTGHMSRYGSSDCIYRENTPFEATMTIDGMYSGQSAKGVFFRDETGKRWSMFIMDLVDALSRSTWSDGTTKGTWVVRKRGANYGIALVP